MVVTALTLTAGFLVAKTLGRAATGHVSAPSQDGQDHQWALDAIAGGDLPGFALGRPVYRYSVVPGGTHNPVELRDAIARDAVVAAHYASVDQSRLRTEVVPADRYVHVSYRKGDRVFWTKKKVLLRRGETILTDGATQIRARCGNCISEQAAEPTATEEPDVVEFDRLTEALPNLGATEEVVLVPIAKSGTQGPAGDPAATSPLAGLGLASQGGAPFTSAGSPDVGASTPDPLLAATKAGHHEPGAPGNPGQGPNPPGRPGIDLPMPPGGDEPFPPIDPFPPDPDNPFPPGLEDPPGPENPLPPTENPPDPGPENPTPVPEPGTLLLVGGGAAELIRRYRRRSAGR